ncbi:XRE family transcriptional regulator [Hymenobacter gummosus]|uniref:XRE family transcriptional regulator n=1 Tax=Hymenobacter gummosus TaxID=1776032 RepID=A0A3S0QEQ4_9BACT|nr:helix-turn-helix transcriptional regulator [Hymenobacter gummosus]RTQ45723.1 XRE family transcriptional regulator [Hymenobacter gummosus]
MPRRIVSISLLARVRNWFGLTQAEIALYLGISPPLARDIESERRPLSYAVTVALMPLLHQLPPPEVSAAVPGPAAPLPPATPAPDAADLDLRRRECLHRATRLLREAEGLAQRARVAARWAEALPALLPPEPGTALPDTPAGRALAGSLAQAADPTDPARAVDHARWLRGWLRHRARPLSAAEATCYHRLRAQAAGLQAEAAALAAEIPASLLELS